jgi:hypothetical protein
VSGYLSRARTAGVSWPLPADLDDEQLEALLFPPAPAIAADQRPMPDWAWVHRELRRPNVTLALLWEEYRAGASDGFGYSWFCDLYRGWAGRLKPTMRQTHIAGEKLFVDFAGRVGEVVDGLTGEIIPVQIFVAVLGASSFTYAEAVWNQKLPDWIAAHVRYTVRNGATGHWAGDRSQTTLWQIDKPLKSETGHGSQKPVECMKRPIANNSSPGQAVYDPFLGSGTTIIAAEIIGRVAISIEIAPAYVDVAVKRWQNFTGEAAVLDGDDRNFDDVAAKRGVGFIAHTPAAAPRERPAGDRDIA